MTETPSLTRQQLYDAVWSTSLKQLAEQYRMSGTKLAQICDRENVPRPPVGYWSMKAHGKQFEIPVLPDVDQLDSKILVKVGSYSSLAESEPIVDSFFDKELGKLAERETMAKFLVKEKLHSPHPLISLTKQGLGKKQNSIHNRCKEILVSREFDGETCMAVAVSKAQVNRALRILDAIIKACQKRGYKFETSGDQWNRRKLFVAHQQRFEIKIREPCRQILHTPTEQEKQDKARHSWRTWPKHDFLPSGNLLLELHGNQGWGPLLAIKDRKKKKIEERIGEIFVQVLRSVDSKRKAEFEAEKRRIEKLRQDAIRREAEKLEQQKEQQRQEEIKRRQALFDEATLWNRCNEVRKYLKATELIHAEKFGSIDAGSELDRWLKWAATVVIDCDPLETTDNQEFHNLKPR